MDSPAARGASRPLSREACPTALSLAQARCEFISTHASRDGCRFLLELSSTMTLAGRLRSPVRAEVMNISIQDAEALTHALLAALDGDGIKPLGEYAAEPCLAVEAGDAALTESLTQDTPASRPTRVVPAFAVLGALLPIRAPQLNQATSADTRHARQASESTRPPSSSDWEAFDAPEAFLGCSPARVVCFASCGHPCQRSHRPRVATSGSMAR